MLRKPGICQKPVITLYETPAYAACGIAVGAEPTGVQPGTGTPENGGVADEILFGWQYEVLEEKDSFYKIRTHYGYEGWIAAEEYVSMESVGDTGVCYDAQNSGCAMQLLQVCQNIADVLEAERVQARRITTLYAGSLIWAEKDSALGDSSAAARLLQPGWRRVFLPDGMGGLRDGYMRSRFSGAVPRTGAVEKMGAAAVGDSDGAYRSYRCSVTVGAGGMRGCRRAQVGRNFSEKHPADCVFLSRDAVPLGRENSRWN